MQILTGLVMLLLFVAAPVRAQEPTRANFWREDDKVLFWQTNHLSGGQGTCVVKFGFLGSALKEPLENLTLSIRIKNKNGTDLGLAKLVVVEPFGATGAGRYAEATFEGVHRWPNQDDGERSPLCYEGASLTVESAIGKQSGKIVDLVRFGQLEFTSFQRLQVKVKE